MRKAVWLLVLAIGCFPATSLAESKGSGPTVQKFEEVERGFFLRTTMGVAVAVTDMFGDDRSSGFWPPGPILQLEAGYDLGQVASIHLAILGQQIVGARDMGTRADLSNDAAMLAVMLGARFNLITGKRIGWYLKAAVGWMFTTPDVAQFDPGLFIQAGTGIEYATMLRHFFIGLEACGSYDLANGGVLVSLSPTLKYTF